MTLRNGDGAIAAYLPGDDNARLPTVKASLLERGDVCDMVRHFGLTEARVLSPNAVDAFLSELRGVTFQIAASRAWTSGMRSSEGQATACAPPNRREPLHRSGSFVCGIIGGSHVQTASYVGRRRLPPRRSGFTTAEEHLSFVGRSVVSTAHGFAAGEFGPHYRIPLACAASRASCLIAFRIEANEEG